MWPRKHAESRACIVVTCSSVDMILSRPTSYLENKPEIRQYGRCPCPYEWRSRAKEDAIGFESVELGSSFSNTVMNVITTSCPGECRHSQGNSIGAFAHHSSTKARSRSTWAYSGLTWGTWALTFPPLHPLLPYEMSTSTTSTEIAWRMYVCVYMCNICLLAAWKVASPVPLPNWPFFWVQYFEDADQP